MSLGSCNRALQFLSVLCTLRASQTLPFLPSLASLCSLSIAVVSPPLSLPCLSYCLCLNIFSSLLPCALCSQPLPPLCGLQAQKKRFGQILVEISQGPCVYSNRLCLRAMLFTAKATLMPTVSPTCLLQYLILYHLSAKVELEESGERHRTAHPSKMHCYDDQYKVLCIQVPSVSDLHQAAHRKPRAAF